ncbi:MAG: hypothetical protein GKS06_12430 [Acidobacteria bacterium]|nr:hypothetical protein [Acidobacteriota bacterium]
MPGMLKTAVRTRVALTLLAATATACGAPPTTGREGLHAVIVADDQRGGGDAPQVLQAAITSSDATVRAAAATALGRLEQPEYAIDLAALASKDTDLSVRLAATHAVAQAGSTSDGAQVGDLLVQVLNTDGDYTVRGAAAAGLGRLRYADPARVGQVEGLLRDILGAGDPAGVEGAARGLAALFRNHREHAAADTTVTALSAAMASDGSDLARVASVAALAAPGQLTGDALNAAQASPITEIRRRAVAAAPSDDAAVALPAIDAALGDAEGAVRLEAIRALRGQPDAQRCARLLTALEDAWPPAQLTAIAGLASCPGAAIALEPIADGAWDEMGWQPRARALASLSRLSPAAAGMRLEAAASAEPWQARMYAARAAGEIGEQAVLRELAADGQHPNVREAALRGLDANADVEPFVDALSSPDYQLVMTAANALADTDDAHIEPLLLALERISAEQRETSRDPRMALLRSLDAFGSALEYERLEPYLSDFDPEIVARVTAMVTTRNGGRPVIGEARPLPPLPFPTLEQLDEIASTTATLRMSSGRNIQLRFLPFEAPTHAARFTRLAADGYFDGLTLHRVVFNFVLQGGSPGANEFMGDGMYTRDEITARAHLRGTVGTSTRGRDTGDGQIFINLIDNLRLDFNYTIFAEVIGDVDAIDAVLEGAVIESVTLDRSEGP